MLLDGEKYIKPEARKSELKVKTQEKSWLHSLIVRICKKYNSKTSTPSHK